MRKRDKMGKSKYLSPIIPVLVIIPVGPDKSWPSGWHSLHIRASSPRSSPPLWPFSALLFLFLADSSWRYPLSDPRGLGPTDPSSTKTRHSSRRRVSFLLHSLPPPLPPPPPPPPPPSPSRWQSSRRRGTIASRKGNTRSRIKYLGHATC